jgi:hypothetical protein
VKRPISASTNLTSAPVRRTALAVAMKVRSGTMTSSPGLIPLPIKARAMAAVPLVTATQWRAPMVSATRSSKARVTSPALM